MMGSFMFGGWMIIVWIIVIGLIIWGVTAFTRHNGSGTISGSNRTPLDIAKERFAKGEISQDEYELIKKNLA